MKRVYGGKELLLRAKVKAKRRDKKRIKMLVKRHSMRVIGKPGGPPVKSPEINSMESSNQN
jgi:hypothetical protein